MNRARLSYCHRTGFAHSAPPSYAVVWMLRILVSTRPIVARPSLHSSLRKSQYRYPQQNRGEYRSSGVRRQSRRLRGEKKSPLSSFISGSGSTGSAHFQKYCTLHIGTMGNSAPVLLAIDPTQGPVVLIKKSASMRSPVTSCTAFTYFALESIALTLALI